uniref:Uncharacterized protein KIAA1841-like n=1 Tax=Phallusia mammillata TaxID=59560 RepID=A0A6F9DGA0_9ASCI|nr:uncharacterized protein KIAA1841-like [Phallusia mammillata]
METKLQTHQMTASLQKLGISTNLKPGGNGNNMYGYIYSLLAKRQGGNAAQDVNEKGKTLSELSEYGYNVKPAGSDSQSADDRDTEVLNQTSGPNMVIHVCDEAKNLKQDFTCPRDLLIQEMKYFADYLSVESQRLEEVDISVHCDIHIFDWLMRYVKRGTELLDDSKVPQLDPSNVISILISSDFLKMETLVENCITFCHKNMSSVISAPCNMNCVNEKLTSLLAARFTHNELEDVRDRKDKFKSKLYCKKIEKLFESNPNCTDSLGQACYLFKCSICHRVMTVKQSCSIPCSSEQTTIGRKGDLQHKHLPDRSWDVNFFIVQLYEELHRWSLVYWRLWGLVNNLVCSRCGNTFQLCEFGQCKYHTERAQYQVSTGSPSDTPLGGYPCCEQETFRFDPSGLIKGCSARDHIVTSPDSADHKCLDDFLVHKNVIKSTKQEFQVQSPFNIFAVEEKHCNVKTSTSPVMQHTKMAVPIVKSMGYLKSTSVTQKQMTRGGRASASEDETTGDEEVVIERKSYFPDTQMHYPTGWSGSMSSTNLISPTDVRFNRKGKEKAKLPVDPTMFSKYSCKQKWDSSCSIRWNQDAQREEDHKRLRNMSFHINKQKQTEKPDKTKAKDVKEVQGGIFRKLELAFINSNRWSSSTSQMPNTGRQYQAVNAKDVRGRLRYLGR